MTRSSLVHRYINNQMGKPFERDLLNALPATILLTLTTNNCANYFVATLAVRPLRFSIALLRA